MNRMLVTRKNTGGRPNKLSEKTIDLVVNEYNQGEIQKELAKKYYDLFK